MTTLVVSELRIASSGLGWKATDGEDNLTTVASSDIKWIQWIRCVDASLPLCPFDQLIREEVLTRGSSFPVWRDITSSGLEHPRVGSLSMDSLKMISSDCRIFALR